MIYLSELNLFGSVIVVQAAHARAAIGFNFGQLIQQAEARTGDIVTFAECRFEGSTPVVYMYPALYTHMHNLFASTSCAQCAVSDEFFSRGVHVKWWHDGERLLLSPLLKYPPRHRVSLLLGLFRVSYI